MTFHVKMRKRPSKDIAPDYYEDENWNSDVHWQWLVFCKMALVFFFRGGGVILEDDSTQRLRGKPYNKVAIFLHRFILLV